MSADYSQILKNVRKHIDLEKGELDYFTSLLRVHNVVRKQFILREGAACTAIHYVHSGAFRAYAVDHEGNESMVMFALNDWWVTDMHGLVTAKPSILNICALEDSVVLTLQKSDLEKL